MDFQVVPSDCTDLGNGQLDGAHGFGGGYGAQISTTGVLFGGIGYMSDEQITPTGAEDGCSVVVTTNKVLVQPVSNTSTFNVATTGVEVINVTTFTGFFSEAYESQVFAQRLKISNVLTVINVVVWFLVLVELIFVGLCIMYEDALTEEVLKSLNE